MSLIDTREISKVKIMMVGGGGGSDAATLAGIGKKVSVSGKTVTTDIDLFRAPKEGDRLLVFFDSLVDDPDTMIVYNDGTPVSISLVGEMIPLEYYLNGLCVFQLKTNFITSTPYWDLIERSEGVSYTAGKGIEITNGTIRNILPQLGDNSQLKSVDSVTQGRLGSYSGDVKYLLIHFDTDAEPYSGAYSLMLSYSGSVAIMKYATLYDRVMGMEYDREIYSGSTLLCEIMDEGTGTQADPIHVDVLGTIDGYVTAGWGRQAALGDRATAEGMGTEASGNYAHAHGYQTTASGNQSTAMGYGTTASADGATAMGNGSTASGANSLASGYNTTASGAVSTAIGTNTQATQQAQVAMGKYNKTNNDAIVMVGNGTGASARSNALEVLLNGDVVAGNEIIDGQGNTLSVLAEALTKTASGNPVVITDCAGGKARSLKTVINAIQDLHGLPFPYVGGASKQLIPMTVSGIKANNTHGTWNGNVFSFHNGAIEILTDNADNVIGLEVKTLPTENMYMNLGDRIAFTADVSYYVSNDYKAEGSYVVLERVGDQTTRYTAQFTYTPSSNVSKYAQIVIRTDETVKRIMRPMVRLSTETDASFAPYSNICPISGRTAVAVDDVGKNYIPTQNTTTQNGVTITLQDGYYSLSGTATGNVWFLSPQFTVEAGTYVLTGCPKNGSASTYFQFLEGDATKADYGNGRTLTFTEKTTIQITFTVKTGTNVNGLVYKPMLREASITDATFEPYAHSSATIQLGTTVYGAEINWDTGVCTVDRVLADNSLLTVFRNNTAGTGTLASFNKTNNGYASQNAYTTSIFKPQTVSAWESLDADTILTDSATGYCVICTDVPNQTQEQLQQWLTDKGAQICLYLATPQTIQLTPEQLELLKGYNRVSIEDGSIELGYIAKLT